MRLSQFCRLAWLALLAGSIHTIAGAPTEPALSERIPLAPIPLQSTELPPTQPSEDLILPRAGDYMTHLRFGWHYRFHEFDSYLPALTAASTLASFYRSTIYNAEHVWPLALPASELKITQGALTLRLSCKRRTIPWSMVKQLAEGFLRATEDGFTGRFEGRFVWVVTGVTIWVSLRVNPLVTV